MGRPTTLKVGARTGRLVIESVRTFGAGINATAVCLCDCGAHTEVKSTNIRKIKSCGCSQHSPEFRKPRNVDSYQMLPSGEAMMNSLFSSYRAKARRHQQEFTLSQDDFKKIVSGDCTYCGVPPVRKQAHRKDGRPMYNGACMAHGIDRVNNSEGYTLSNSASCCTECNLSKHTRSLKEFEDHCIRVAERVLLSRGTPIL